MEEEEQQIEDIQPPQPRRSLRRSALTELNETSLESSETPRSASPDEMVILQRGPRRKPVTWSPIDFDKTKMLGPPREKTPERVTGRKINPKLRRRLTMSPENEDSALGKVIAEKIKSLQKGESDG